jgi:ribonucleoside-diphosphate reductase alpha chain
VTSASRHLGIRRWRFPDERAAITYKFSIGGHEGHITVGKYPVFASLTNVGIPVV